MATEVVSTIRASGGDYTSLSAWEAGEQKNLVSADEIAIAECYDDWTSGLSDSVEVSGWTADATRFVKITVASGHRHNGTPQSGFFMKKSTASYVPIINLRVAYSVAEWCDVENTSTAAGTPGIQARASNVKLINCIAKASGAATYIDAYYFYSSSSAYVYNCLAYDCPAVGFSCATYTVELLNCVAKGCGTGFSGATEGNLAKNCVSYSNTTNWSGTWSSSSTNNATSSGSDDAPGGSSVISVVSGDFVNAASNDLHLTSNSALIGAGVNLYSTFTTDIDGDTRPSSGAWDIGFDHYVAAGGPPTLVSITPSLITSTGARLTIA